MDFNKINNNLVDYYSELFTNEFLIKYGYYSYKKNKKSELEEYPNSDIFYHKMFNFDDLLIKIPRINNLRVQRDVWTEPVYFNIPKTELLRRQYKLPNLYSYLKLSKYIVAQKQNFINIFLENRQSISKYFDSNELTFAKQKEIELQLLYGGRKRLYTDLANFYHTLYTHSIPWMIIGKWESKKTFSSNSNSFENRLDKLIQQSQFGETHGLPTGSMISRIIAELYMCYFDKRMTDYNFLYKRYVDDFIFSFNKEEEEHDFLEKFNLICREQNLNINSEKTTVLSFPFENVIDKTEVFNYLVKYNFYSETDNKKRKEILKNYINYCISMESRGNKGSLKVIFTGMDIAFSNNKIAESDLAEIILNKDDFSDFSLLEYLIELTFEKPELYNKLLSLLDDYLKNYKSRIKDVFNEYIGNNLLSIKKQLKHNIQNHFDLELNQILLYIVLFGNDALNLTEDEMIEMLSTEVDDYSLCLLVIMYLQNSFDNDKLMRKVKGLLETTHRYYESDRARMTEKLWFFRYFIYSIIKNIPTLSELITTQYIDSELDWTYIQTLYDNSSQQAVNDFYNTLLDENVMFVNCGSNFDFKY